MRVVLLFVLALASCGPHYYPAPAPVPVDTDKCQAAESNLQKLQCRDRAGDPMWVNKLGERFAVTCQKAQTDGRIFVNPACVASAKDCTTANQCPAQGM